MIGHSHQSTAHHKCQPVLHKSQNITQIISSPLASPCMALITFKPGCCLLCGHFRREMVSAGGRFPGVSVWLYQLCCQQSYRTVNLHLQCLIFMLYISLFHEAYVSSHTLLFTHSLCPRIAYFPDFFLWTLQGNPFLYLFRMFHRKRSLFTQCSRNNCSFLFSICILSLSPWLYSPV